MSKGTEKTPKVSSEVKCPLPAKGFSLNPKKMDEWIKVLKELSQSLSKTSSA